MAANKKPFINRDNPAFNFISTINTDTDSLPDAPEPKREAKPATAPKAQRKNPEQKKTHRVQLVMTEALYNAIKEESWKAHASLNDYVCKLLEENTK